MALSSSTIKYISLFSLTAQNAALALLSVYTRTRPGDMFSPTVAVLMCEVFKFFTSLCVIYLEEGSKWLQAIYANTVLRPKETLKVCVPAAVYVIQNNLFFVATTHLDAATYQVSYQLKILTTAIFSVLILRRTLSRTQWAAIIILMTGITMVSLAQTEGSGKSSSGVEKNKITGLVAAACACVLSGFSGIYFEMILKGSDISLWIRNMQLSFLSIPVGLFTCLTNDGAVIKEHGFFFGFDAYVWFVVFLQAFGGLIVALVVKHADNILKGFATSLAIVVACMLSIFIFDFQLSIQFTIGATLVIGSIFLYGYKPQPPKRKGD